MSLSSHYCLLSSSYSVAHFLYLLIKGIFSRLVSAQVQEKDFLARLQVESKCSSQPTRVRVRVRIISCLI